MRGTGQMDFESELVRRAVVFATKAHGDQKRRYTGEPYIVHPIEVAQIVLMAGLPEEAVAGAVLHDTVEDTDTTIETIRSEFGDAVAAIVWETTDISRKEDGNRKARKALDREHLARASHLGQSVKCADFLSNTPSIVEHDPNFAKTYLREIRETLGVLVRAHPPLLCAAWDSLQAAEVQIYGPLAAVSGK